MGKFARLIEENNPDAPRYIANTGKYAITDVLRSAGMDVDVKEFHPVFYVTIDGVKYEVTVKEVASAEAGEEEENLNPNLNPNQTLTPEDEKAINVARSLATKPKGGILGMNTPQGKMDKAYGQIMNKVSQKISNVASRL